MHRHIWFTLALFACFSLIPINFASTQAQVGILTGTVKDPNGAVLTNLQVSVKNEATGETRNATTDTEGRFKIENLSLGRYTVSTTRSGFKPAEVQVTVESGRTANLEIKLEIAPTREDLDVSGKGSVAPNSDPNYRALRDGAFGESYEITGVTLKRDVGTLTLTGRMSFLTPVLGKVAIGVFTGEGLFTLVPAIDLEKRYLTLLTEKDSVNEQFDRAIFCFTDKTYDEIKAAGKAGSADQRAVEFLRDFRNKMRKNTETPRSFTEAIFSGEAVENVEASLLEYLYNPKVDPIFCAYLIGRKHNDLRFYVRPRGALPRFLSPEEVAVVKVSADSKDEGIWYLSHYVNDWKNGKASSAKDKRSIDALNYRIETAIKGDKLTANCELTFEALADGDRVLTLGLLPSLRVSKVTFGDKEIGYVQEKRNEDSAFHAIFPEALVKGQKYKLNIEYQGNKVIEDAGGGNFAVGARTSWYPSVNAFNDRATFNLTFTVSNKFTLVGVGKLVKEAKEGDYIISNWVSDVPLAVAGFNYGRFKKKEVKDDQANYLIEGYATSDLPDSLRGAEEIGGMTPTRLTDKALVEAQNSMRIFNKYFGETPYGRVAITQQPELNFGQSWPTLVYLPIIAFFDSTQRYRLFGMQQSLTNFVDEVTSHEVAHQWWGHVVGWSSYHDQWLSEGFADFSASLYLQFTEGGKLDKYLKFWDNQSKVILERNNFGFRPNDVGPIWMGVRLNTQRTGGAYSRLVYPKGSYVLHMIRWMMYENKTGDQKFIDMMRDFVKTHYNGNATTESFKFIVEKHMKPGMDLAGNKRMDWFFNQWVYGTEVPRYKFEYTLTPESDGNVVLSGTLTQSDVSPGFMMPVPVYLELEGGRIFRLGEVKIMGNTTTAPFQVKLPQKPKRVMINYHRDILAIENISVGK
ncbi:MAG: carboxypeptidase regulatory-like domain-containing protein [Acidobacteria bacterium]|nr:carboxypeptidase regulatory-like domain-containing protein [Acidobacteriota bacterium]